MSGIISLFHLAEVNPLTPQFKELADGSEVPFMPLENIWAYGKADQTATRVWKKSDTSYTQFHNGDLLVPKVTPTVFHGRSMITSIDSEIGLATSEVHVLRCKDGVEPRWVLFNLLSGKFLDEARGAVHGVGGLQRISTQYLQSYKVANIPLATQRRIADYLDAETGQIDALVTELDEYVELLEKRKQLTIISESKILDKFQPKTRLGWHASVMLGKTKQSSQKNKDDVLMKYVRAGNIQPDGVFDNKEECMWFASSEINQYSLRAGDVLVVEGGAGFGRSLTLLSDLDGWCFQNHIIRIRPDRGWSSQFIDYVIRAYKAIGYIDLLTVGATIPGFSAEKAKNLGVPFISFNEQEEIAQRITEELTRTNTIIAECRELKELLLKRRQVLITDVVTGKVEV